MDLRERARERESERARERALLGSGTHDYFRSSAGFSLHVSFITYTQSSLCAVTAHDCYLSMTCVVKAPPEVTVTPPQTKTWGFANDAAHISRAGPLSEGLSIG